MNNKCIGMTIAALATATLFAGCNKTEEGATWGAGLGALAGQAIGGDSKGTLIGAGVGALVGGAIGNDQQKDQDRYRQQRQANGNGTTMRRTTIQETLNADGSVSKSGTTTTTSSETTGGYTGLED